MGASETPVDPPNWKIDPDLAAAAEEADAALTALHDHPLGCEAARIGEIHADPPGIVVLRTTFGGTRIVDMLVGDPLPRIC